MRVARLAILCVTLTLVACGTPRYIPDPNTHIVRRGETLFSIAWRYGKDPVDVARWNGLGDGSLIHPGQTLYLEPRSGTVARPAPTTSRPTPQSLPKVPTQPPPPWSWPTRGTIDVEFGGNVEHGKQHGKYIVTDDLGFVGTTNFDYRSRLYNNEMGFFFESESLAEEIRENTAYLIELSYRWGTPEWLEMRKRLMEQKGAKAFTTRKQRTIYKTLRNTGLKWLF